MFVVGEWQSRVSFVPSEKVPADIWRVNFVFELRVKHNEHVQQHQITAGWSSPYPGLFAGKENNAFRFSINIQCKGQNVPY